MRHAGRAARLPIKLAFPALMLIASPARAVLDIGDRGPTLQAGNFAMRITNAGIIGNAFFNTGLSSDPSFEFPRGSGNEALNHAELWVGGLDARGQPRVSGGPMLEWRPTLDPADHVLTGWSGQPGSRQLVDDDGDGKIDEEIFNGKDDDGDGEIDEDMGFPAQQVLAADYVDDRPEAINYGYPTGETHEPLGLSVHQEAYAWSVPGYTNIAGLQFTITNHSDQPIRDVYVGLMADLDSRGRNDAAGHLDDRVVHGAFSVTIPEGTASGRALVDFFVRKVCSTTIAQSDVPVIVDGSRTDLPAVAVIGLGHTTDPLGPLLTFVGQPAELASAPATESFRYSVYANDLPAGQGGVPQLDVQRYAALRGEFPVASEVQRHDYVVLVSAGPFPHVDPGKSFQFAVALVVASSPDSLAAEMMRAAFTYHGVMVNWLPDSAATNPAFAFEVGETGQSGHEICLEPPPGVVFQMDPDCSGKYLNIITTEALKSQRILTYEHGHCIWTDADCDICTGYAGKETRVHWLNPGSVPPSPTYRITPLDHRVDVAWDNSPEVLLDAGISGTPGFKYEGYRVYRFGDFSHRTGLVPGPRQWERFAAFGLDTLNGELPLASITDTTLRFTRISYGEKLYPVGRYHLTDDSVLDGFDYLYAVTAVSEKRTVLPGGNLELVTVESPLVSSLDSLVTPHARSRPNASAVWVVPNPYRAHAPWDRAQVIGDPFGRHIDFMGLPRARCVIKIWTLAGDLVARVEHDGTRGDGEASWNLISRNGQDVESGLYLFTVDSPLGRSTGRFVIVR